MTKTQLEKEIKSWVELRNQYLQRGYGQYLIWAKNINKEIRKLKKLYEQRY